MNDEIKEMTNEEYVEFLNTIDTLPIKEQEIIRRGVLQLNDDKKQLFECITNLQQENERLNYENIVLREYLVNNKKAIPNELSKDKDFIELLDMPTYDDYKSRCENAIEYVENRIVEDDYMLKTETEMVQRELLNILQNGSEEDV